MIDPVTETAICEWHWISKHRRFVEKARVLDAEGNDPMLHELLPDLE